MYLPYYPEYNQIVWFRLVGAPGQQIEDNILRNSPLRLSGDTEGKGVRLKNRYLVDRYNDVRDGCRWKSFQDNKIGGIDKNS